MMKSFESERLIYVPLNDSHFETFYFQEKDPEVMRYIRTPAENEAEARMKFKTYLAYTKLWPRLGTWTVIEKSSQREIGLGVLFHFGMNPETNMFEVGYRFNQEAWGKGYATELTKAFVEHGFRDHGMKEIYAVTHPENEASQKVLLKAGFEFVGKTDLRDNTILFKIKKI